MTGKACLPILAATAILGASQAGGFEVIEPEVEPGTVEFEAVNSIFAGDLDKGGEDEEEESEGEDDDDEEGFNRNEHEIGVGVGISRFWGTEVSIEIANPTGPSNAAAEGLEWANTFAIVGGETGVEAGDLALALYAAFEYEFENAEDVELTVGPAIGYEFGEVEVIANPFVSVALGGGDETNFLYALSAMTEIAEDVSAGFEAHGEIESAFDNAPDISEQEHFIGPAVAFEIEPEAGREVEGRLGTFFGLTDATPTVGISFNLEIGF